MNKFTTLKFKLTICHNLAKILSFLEKNCLDMDFLDSLIKGIITVILSILFIPFLLLNTGLYFTIGYPLQELGLKLIFPNIPHNNLYYKKLRRIGNLYYRLKVRNEYKETK